MPPYAVYVFAVEFYVLLMVAIYYVMNSILV
jgi:hypothetical protein